MTKFATSKCWFEKWERMENGIYGLSQELLLMFHVILWLIQPPLHLLTPIVIFEVMISFVASVIVFQTFEMTIVRA